MQIKSEGLLAILALIARDGPISLYDVAEICGREVQKNYDQKSTPHSAVLFDSAPGRNVVAIPFFLQVAE